MTGDFLAGAISMGFAIAALMFLKFWKRTGEGLFLAFSASFLLLAANQTLLAFTRVTIEERSSLYLIRLAAFLLIIVAFWLKNRSVDKRGAD